LPIAGRGAAKAEQRGELERGDPDDGHQPHQDGHQRLQSAHPTAGSITSLDNVFRLPNSSISLIKCIQSFRSKTLFNNFTR
jgi:hypothetical protein